MAFKFIGRIKKLSAEKGKEEVIIEFYAENTIKNGDKEIGIALDENNTSSAVIPNNFIICAKSGNDIASHPFYNLLSSNISERFEIEYEGNDIKKVTILR